MDFDLVVVAPFDAYVAGARITDPAVITAILAGSSQNFVVRASKVAGGTGPVTPPAAVLATDTLSLRRSGAERVVTVGDLQDVLSPNAVTAALIFA